MFFPSLVKPNSLQALPVKNNRLKPINIKKGDEVGIALLSGENLEHPLAEFNKHFSQVNTKDSFSEDYTKPPPVDNGVTFAERLEFLDENLKLDSGDLTTEQNNSLKKLIYEYADLISTKDTDIGRTHLATHEIKTGDAKPICQKPYRVEFKNRHVIEEEIEKMLSIDLIEPAVSPWASPVVLIPKPDGSIRFCVDFRKVNAVTVRDSFPLPRIDDIIPQLGKKKFFVGLDLASGYWQVPISNDHDSKNKTTFTCHVGTFRFKYMPFGGVNCPATFQRLMQQVLGPQYNKTVFCYLDDILVTGETWLELTQELKVVFQKLREAHLKLKLKKCEWGKSKIEYLGHLLDHDGYSPKEKKVQAILDRKPPKTLKELRALIGAFGFYAKFIPHYTDLMRPLHHLLKHNAVSEWSDECEAAHQKLKKAITEAPVLAFPDQKKPFNLYTDASAEAIGAVLAQVQDDGIEHPLAYYSKALTKSEMNYSNTERECLAVLVALKHYYPVLYGCKVTVFTDHMAAFWLHKQENPTKRAAIFQDHFRSEISWEVKHVSGKDNAMADYLSRFPDFAESQEKFKTTPHRKIPEVTVKVPQLVQVTTRAQAKQQQKSLSFNKDEKKGDDQPLSKN